MEIINFVQDNNTKNLSNRFYKKTSGLFSKQVNNQKKFNQKEEVSFAFDYSAENRVFGAGKVRKNFSIKNIVLTIGKTLTDFTSILSNNKKKVFFTTLIISLLALASVFGIRYLSFRINHTNAIDLSIKTNLDDERVNEIMKCFALANSVSEDYYTNEQVELPIDSTLFEKPVSYQTYKVLSGDTISGIAKKFGLKNISSLISVNNIDNVRYLKYGQKLKIPSIDGILYKVQKNDTIQSIVEKNKIKLESLLDVNELSSETLSVGQELFLPGVGLDQTALRNAMGELFRIPIRAKFRWTSDFGYRIDPIKGVPSNHTGVDMACPTGTPIYSAMSGTVKFTGSSNVFGKYVIVDHGNGYQTLYAHMSKITSKKGQYVSQNTQIGLVGNTGYSTGPHLHFTVYKNGKIINPKTVLNKSK